jgi:hypothetical protein
VPVTTTQRDRAAVVVAATPASMVIDTITDEGGRRTQTSGIPDGDAEEFIVHLTDTVQNILDALLPILADALGCALAPARWWAVSGGDRTLVVAKDRVVVVPAARSDEFVKAVQDGIRIDGVRIW